MKKKKKKEKKNKMKLCKNKIKIKIIPIASVLLLTFAIFMANMPTSTAIDKGLEDYVGGYPPETTYPNSMFRGNLQRTGFTESPAPESDHLLWKEHVSSGGSARSVVVERGVVYGSDGRGTIYALNANTGEEVWRVFTGQAAGGSFVDYADGRIYTGINNDRIYTLARLNAVSGVIEWTYDFPKALINASVPLKNHLAGTPTVIEEFNGAGVFITSTTKIYVAAGDTLFGLQDLGNSVKTLWTFTLPEPSDIMGYGFCGGGRQGPVYDNGKLFIATRERGTVYALNATSGKQIWNFSMSSFAPYMGSISDGVLYWGDTKGILYALDEETGKEKWTFKTGDFPVTQGPSIAYGMAYTSTYLAPVGKPDITVLDKTTGELKWTWELPEGYAGFKGAWHGTTIADGKVFIIGAGTGAWLQVLDAYNGTLLWEKDFSNMVVVASEPVVADGRLYLQAGDGYLYCFGEGPTSTDVSVTDANIAKGTTIAAYGSIYDKSPASLDAPITNVPVKLMVQKAGDSSWSDIGTTATDSNGRFTYEWTPTNEGTYWLQAQFEGDVTYGLSNATTAIQVNPAPAVNPATAPSPSPAVTPPTSGMPTTTYIAIVAAVIIVVVAAAVLVLRKRKSKP